MNTLSCAGIQIRVSRYDKLLNMVGCRPVTMVSILITSLVRSVIQNIYQGFRKVTINLLNHKIYITLNKMKIYV